MLVYHRQKRTGVSATLVKMGGGTIKEHFTAMNSLNRYTALTTVNRKYNSLGKQGFVRGHLACWKCDGQGKTFWHESMIIFSDYNNCRASMVHG